MTFVGSKFSKVAIAYMDGKVSPDGSREGSGRVGFTKHNTTSLHCVQTLPNLEEANLNL